MAKTHYLITFAKGNGRNTTFHRWEATEWQAVSEAVDGFQWNYGYHPGEPISVEVAP